MKNKALLHVRPPRRGWKKKTAGERGLRPLSPGKNMFSAHSMDFSDSAMSIRRRRGRIPTAITAVNTIVSPRERR